MLNRDQIWQLARSVHPFAVQARRHLHQYPELSFREEQTSAYVAEQLRAMGYELQTGLGGFGIKAVLTGAKPGPTVALRADMDALPITEETGLAFASKNPGVMHACGHDVHTAILLGAAKALKSLQAELPGNVVFIFQPGEEVNPGGASLMIKDGVLENPKVDAIFGLHAMPYQECGTMGFGAGPLLAAPDEIHVTIVGKGGHAAGPQFCVDPILAACQFVTLVQQVVSRNVGPFETAVVNIGLIRGGTAPNIIPDTVQLEGTIRTMSREVREQMPQRIEAILKGVCDAAGATYQFVYDPGYPVLVNDPAMTDLARRAATHALGEQKVSGMQPSMGGEDFAYYLERVPGTFARLGSATPGTEHPAGLHTSRLMIDEECLAVGMAYYISVAQQFLHERTGTGK